MRKIVAFVGAIAVIGGTATAFAAAPEFPDLIAFDRDAGEFPEGVAVDKMGNVLVGFDSPRGEVRKFTPTGEESLLIDFGNPGVLGLAVDAVGNVYAARQVQPNNGVYKVDEDGNAILVPGTDAIVFPNSLAFDNQGNLYITETFSFDPPLTSFGNCGDFGLGGIWKVPKGGDAELFLRHDLLTGLCISNPPIPFPIGANGIAFRHGELFVVNTEKAIVVRVPIDARGEAGEPETVATVPDIIPPQPFVPELDGLALDVHGNMYVPVITQSRIVKISADGSTIETVATDADGLDFPASLAFGTGRGERQSLFVTNFAIGPPGGAGPGLVKMDVGEPGQPVP
ncbi:MAG TPA: SMP-30/gluconolactonase/LRE family protein [Acidimicrobiia bacterium]|nr:SMP-30/gluconolactonase/LRE family protein [Acidimicrobiia bacterium]